MFAPTGIGVLYGRLDLLNELPPWQGGGEMIDHVSIESSTYQQAPFRFELARLILLAVQDWGRPLITSSCRCKR